MDEERMKSFSTEDAPSFGRSFRGTAELSMAATAEFAGKDDFTADDFEFSFGSIKSDHANADKIFENGRILPFNGDLVGGGLKPQEEEKSVGGSASSFSSMPSEAYSVLKSKSMGTVGLESSRLRLRDIVVGRSRSEGDKLRLEPASGEKKMEKSCFFLFSNSHKSAAKEAEKKGERRKEGELDIVKAHPRRIAGGGQTAIAGPRRTFLPYRPELFVGCFFCHSRRNQFSRIA